MVNDEEHQRRIIVFIIRKLNPANAGFFILYVCLFRRQIFHVQQ